MRQTYHGDTEALRTAKSLTTKDTKEHEGMARIAEIEKQESPQITQMNAE
jgi:hypothetical protein